MNGPYNQSQVILESTLNQFVIIVDIRDALLVALQQGFNPLIAKAYADKLWAKDIS